MLFIFAGVALVVLAGVVLLARFVSKGGGPRTALWAGLLVLVTIIAMLTAQIASVYYRMPIGWIVALVLAGVLLIVLFVRIGADVKWKPVRVVALVGLMIGTLIAMTIALIAIPLGNVFVPVFEVRAQQIAEANGFEALFAPDEGFVLDYLPVDTVPDPDKGLSMEYEGFVLQERKAEGGLSLADLEEIAAAGEDPMGFGRGIPDDVTYEALTVGGNPALGAEFSSPGGDIPEKQSTTRLLIFEKDGVDVRIFSESHVEYQGGDEIYAFVDALSFGEMVQVAETLEPLK